jgi:hypothetical protein
MLAAVIGGPYQGRRVPGGTAASAVRNARRPLRQVDSSRAPAPGTQRAAVDQGERLGQAGGEPGGERPGVGGGEQSDAVGPGEMSDLVGDRPAGGRCRTSEVRVGQSGDERVNLCRLGVEVGQSPARSTMDGPS